MTTELPREPQIDLWVSAEVRTQAWIDHARELRAAAEKLALALGRVAMLDPVTDSDEGLNEWGEADCFRQAQEIARNALAPTLGAERDSVNPLKGPTMFSTRCSVSFEHPAHDYCDGNPGAKFAAPSTPAEPPAALTTRTISTGTTQSLVLGPAADCRDIGDVCKLGKPTGICCADGECDIASGIRSPAAVAGERDVQADPELLAFWRTLPALSNERLAVELIETLQRRLASATAMAGTYERIVGYKEDELKQSAERLAAVSAERDHFERVTRRQDHGEAYFTMRRLNLRMSEELDSAARENDELRRRNKEIERLAQQHLSDRIDVQNENKRLHKMFSAAAKRCRDLKNPKRAQSRFEDAATHNAACEACAQMIEALASGNGGAG